MFKVGDKVKIAKNSKYYSYQGGDSKKGEVVSLDSSGWIDVRFENGTMNCYQETDLVFDDDCKHIQEEQQLMQLIKPKNKKRKLSIN